MLPSHPLPVTGDASILSAVIVFMYSFMYCSSVSRGEVVVLPLSEEGQKLQVQSSWARRKMVMRRLASLLYMIKGDVRVR